MSELTDALNRISNWMEALNSFPLKDGQKIAPYRPGLSDTDIKNLTDNLPLKLPQEVKEFYKWHNGSWSSKDCLFSDAQDKEMIEFLYVNPGLMYGNLRPFIDEEVDLFSLDEAVSCFGYTSEFDEKPYLPIFTTENSFYSLLILGGDITPVLLDDYEIAFPSLTVLMQCIAELLENLDSLKSILKSSLTVENKLELEDRLINEVAHNYVEKSKYRYASILLNKIITRL